MAFPHVIPGSRATDEGAVKVAGIGIQVGVGTYWILTTGTCWQAVKDNIRDR